MRAVSAPADVVAVPAGLPESQATTAMRHARIKLTSREICFTLNLLGNMAHRAHDVSISVFASHRDGKSIIEK
jgi:hypothetical protein